jgi:hypothetical protein
VPKSVRRAWSDSFIGHLVQKKEITVKRYLFLIVMALREGWIAGAALDVFTAEPTPADNPLMGMEQVILAPHVGSFTAEGVRRMSVESAEQVLQVLRGERLPNLVNPPVWDRRRQRPNQIGKCASVVRQRYAG